MLCCAPLMMWVFREPWGPATGARASFRLPGRCGSPIWTHKQTLTCPRCSATTSPARRHSRRDSAPVIRWRKFYTLLQKKWKTLITCPRANNCLFKRGSIAVAGGLITWPFTCKILLRYELLWLMIFSLSWKAPWTLQGMRWAFVFFLVVTFLPERQNNWNILLFIKTYPETEQHKLSLFMENRTRQAMFKIVDTDQGCQAHNFVCNWSKVKCLREPFGVTKTHAGCQEDLDLEIKSRYFCSGKFWTCVFFFSSAHSW